MNAIALDARSTRQMSVGMKAYTRELSSALPDAAPDMRFIPFTRGTNFSLREQIGLPLAIRRSRADLTHFLSLYAPVLRPRPYVVTIHDLIHLRFPHQFKRRVRPYYRTVVRSLLHGAARVITDDVRTAGDLQRFLNVDPARVVVIPLGVSDVFLQPPAAHRAPRPYLIYAGNRRAHKDLETLFAAWKALPDEIELDLYLTGSEPLVSAHARERGAIVQLGEISAESLASYYAGARALVYPSLCEGFGLPMLEAAACGTAIVACEDALPSVLRGAALTFPAGDAAAARAAIMCALSDEGSAGRFVNEARARARELTWGACARATAQVYREVLQEV